MKFFGRIAKRLCTLIGGIVVIVILCAACSSSNSTNNVPSSDQESSTKKSEEQYEFTEKPTLVYEDYTNKIVGIIKNNSGSDKGYIQISFTLYDADGNNIGTALANTNNLKDGGTWKFEAIALENDVKSFELDEVSGF